MSKFENCPNCNSKIESGIFKKNELFSENKINVINEYSENKKEGYCEKCGQDLFSQNISLLLKERTELNNKFNLTINSIPIITIQSPLNWDYDIIDLVTSQSTTGTGVISEFSSSITDFFGVESNRYNKKIKHGETLCASRLRKTTLDMGGNAIIASDIDYSEIGGDKGMIMVCINGTAINLKNPEVLGEKRKTEILEVMAVNKRLEYLSQFDFAEY